CALTSQAYPIGVSLSHRAVAARLTRTGARCTVARGVWHVVSPAPRGRRMRKLIVTTATLGTLVFAASALAILPSQRSVFGGYTSEHAVNGFRPTLQFTAQAGGRTLTNIVFETLGCFGAGQFPVGVDPFAETPWRLPKLTVPATGVVTTKVNASTNV